MVRTKRETCSDCGGSGLVPAAEDVTSDLHYINIHCPTCGGSGYFDDDDDY